MNDLAAIIVGNADRGARAYRGMAQDCGFHLSGPNIDAASNDEIRSPIGKENIAIGVYVSDISDGLPPIRRRATLRANVLIGRVGPGRWHGEEFSLRANRHFLQVGVQNAHTRASRGPSNRPRSFHPFTAADKRSDQTLGRAIRLPNVVW